MGQSAHSENANRKRRSTPKYRVWREFPELFSVGLHQITRVQDYKCKPLRFQRSVEAWAKRHGMSLSGAFYDDGGAEYRLTPAVDASRVVVPDDSRAVHIPLSRRGRRPFVGTYQEYLLSPQWQQVRQRAFRRLGKKCDHCGSVHRLEIHHRTYIRLFREKLTDLQVLCRDCHARHHGLLA